MRRLTSRPRVRNVALIDGYLDEPSCLGVPPYISPQIRYAYGALLDLGIDPQRIDYFTVDQLRTAKEEYLSLAKSAEIVVVIAGATVPGRYLGGRPMSTQEIAGLAREIRPVPLILGGPIVLCQTDVPEVVYTDSEIAATSLQAMIGGQVEPDMYDGATWAKRIGRFAILGAELTTRHPSYPYVVCELETFRGCPRQQNCAFCSEALKRVRYQRPVEDVVAEVGALAQAGNGYYRLGSQTDLFLYGGAIRHGHLVPEPSVIRDLYQGIRQAAPDLRVLHLDNVNPATIMRDPSGARAVMEIICTYNTPGDVAAFGLESADPAVLAANHIETSPQQTLAAVRLMNEIGGRRRDGIPTLLPGLNLLHGLTGETTETMALNLRYLEELLAQGLMVRRINIRQVLSWGEYQKTYLPTWQFQQYKEQVNERINKPMLERVFPRGTVLRAVHVEEKKGQISFGRQLGSYPILVGIPGEEPLGKILDAVVIDHGYRSVTALPIPLAVNGASIARLVAIPGMGRKRATRVFLARPVDNIRQLDGLLNGQVDLSIIQPFLDFSPV